MATPCVEDEVLFGLENFGVPHEEMPRRVGEALRRAGPEDAVDREIATLSGGKKQKVAVAAVMALAAADVASADPAAVSPDNRSFARASAASGAPCDDATASATPAAVGPSATSTASDAAGASASPAVEFEGVDFSYPGGGASVRGLTFTVAPGECVAVVGENGAGKTTLTKLAAGLLKPQGGTVHVAGLNTLSTRASVIARQTSVLFQNPDRQICQQSVLEEVAFGLVVQGVSRETAHMRARQMIARFGLPEDAEPFALSRGQRQIVALASALACEPKLLVLDEPTSGLDYRECMTMMEAVDELRRSGCAVLMVCHDMEVVSDFATRVIVMAGGRILSDGAPFAAFANGGLMAAARIAPPQVVELAGRLVACGAACFEDITEVSDLVDAIETALAFEAPFDGARASACTRTTEAAAGNARLRVAAGREVRCG